MDYADDSCRLIRSFADGEDVVTLALEQLHPGGPLHVTLVSDALARFKRQYTARFKFAPDAVQFESRYWHTELEDGRTYYSIGPVSIRAAALAAGNAEQLQQLMTQPYRRSDEIEAARKVKSLTVTEGFNRDFELDLGPMVPPMEAMQACMDELLTHWGVDVERHRSMSRPVLPAENPQTWVTEADYPAAERRGRSAGANSVRLMLDAAGKPTSCHLQRRAGAEGFNEAACRILMEKGKFEPALDAAGQPMASYYVVNFQFQLVVGVRGSASALR